MLMSLRKIKKSFDVGGTNGGRPSQDANVARTHVMHKVGYEPSFNRNFNIIIDG